MTRRCRGGSDSHSSPSETLFRLYEIGGAEMALRYQHLRDEALSRDTAAQSPEPLASPEPGATPRSGADELLGLFGVLRGEFDREKGTMDVARRADIEDFMGRLGGLVERGARPVAAGRPGRDELYAHRLEINGLMGDFQTRVANPTLRGPGAQAGSRGERLMARLQALKLYAGQAGAQRGAGAGAIEAGMDLYARIARLTTRLSEAGDDTEAQMRIERDEARGLAAEVFDFARRRHLMLARPVWGCSNTWRAVNHVHVAGPAETRGVLADLAVSRSLTVTTAAPSGADAATRRWRDLRCAGVAVFDLADADPQVYYELGIALACGSQLVLVAPGDTALPFDVAQNVHRYERRSALKPLLDEQIDAALYALQVEPDAQSTLPATLLHAQAFVASNPDPFVHQALESLRAAGDHAARFNAALQAFNGMLGADQHELLLTRWPGRYPDVLEPRWFAVMPFRPSADRGYAMLTAAIGRVRPALRPVRGDLAEDQLIIRSIWDEISRASLVTVDLSGFNPNVCLELGIAHTLGRTTVLVGEQGTETALAQRLPGVAKWRCHAYDASDPRPSAALQAALGAGAGHQ